MEFLKDFFAFAKEERPLIAQALCSWHTYALLTGYLGVIFLSLTLTDATVSTHTALAWGGSCLLISLLSHIDIKHFILPDHITLPLIPVLFFAAPYTSGITTQESLWGLIIGGGGFGLLAFAFYKMTGKHGMGGGDIKLMAALGAWVGGFGIPLLMLSASLASLITLFVRKAMGGANIKEPLPFGPFLCAGAILTILGQDLYWQITHVLFGG